MLRYSILVRELFAASALIHFGMNCSLDTAEQENYIVHNNVWKHNHVYNELENYFVRF
jgi:hypothetical protein